MKKSFTLIELIVVIAIIAILAAIIAPNAFKAIEKAKISQCIADLKAIKTATVTLYADTGQWGVPDVTKVHSYAGDYWVVISDSQLLNNDEAYNGWDGPYLEQTNSQHPWGGHYALWVENQGKGPEQELQIIIEDYGTLSDIPEDTALRIDELIDDGDPLDGNFREEDPNDNEGTYIIQWDLI